MKMVQPSWFSFQIRTDALVSKYTSTINGTVANEYTYTYDANGNITKITYADGTTYEVWTKMLPVRDWAAFEKEWADSNAAANPGEVISAVVIDKK